MDWDLSFYWTGNRRLNNEKKKSRLMIRAFPREHWISLLHNGLVDPQRLIKKS